MMFHFLLIDKMQFPIAEKLEKEVINLFADHYFSIEQAESISNIIIKYGIPALK